jgi:hypothetical protein
MGAGPSLKINVGIGVGASVGGRVMVLVIVAVEADVSTNVWLPGVCEHATNKTSRQNKMILAFKPSP